MMVAAGFQLHLALQGALDLVLHVGEGRRWATRQVVLSLFASSGILPVEVREAIESGRVDPGSCRLGPDEVRCTTPERQAGITRRRIFCRNGVLLLRSRILRHRRFKKAASCPLLLPTPRRRVRMMSATQLVHIARHGALEALRAPPRTPMRWETPTWALARHEDQIAGRQG